jgi:anaerobic magnesium-protoporphyrin IX monomethyl ester cyclase
MPGSMSGVACGEWISGIINKVLHDLWYTFLLHLIKEKVKAMADIVLIYPYVHKHARNAMLFHPLGIAQLSAILRHEGLDTSVVDLTFRSIDEVLSEMVRDQPRVVGVYVMLTMIERARALAKKIRQLVSGVLLVCGGPMPTLRPEQFTPDFDLVFQGEAADSFPCFCRDYLESGTLTDVLHNADLYPGLYTRNIQDGTILHTPLRPTDEEGLNYLPIPDRRDYNHALYQQFWQEREGYSPAGIMTTYGCPYSCDFCSKPIFGSYFRRRNLDSIMGEICDIRSLGYDGLWIADDCFTLDIDHVRAFCHRLIQENFRMTWTCLSRTEEIPMEDVQLMRDAGCNKVFFGLESGSNAVLKLMNKHTTIQAAEHMLHLFSRCGIKTAGFFMVGYPGETYETIEATLSWALTLPLDEISFTIPFPLPDTPLFQKICCIQMDADWSYENENRMIYQSEFDEEYLHKRIDETYDKFASRKRSKTG